LTIVKENEPALFLHYPTPFVRLTDWPIASVRMLLDIAQVAVAVLTCVQPFYIDIGPILESGRKAGGRMGRFQLGLSREDAATRRTTSRQIKKQRASDLVCLTV
jgi:hypothetical protein